MYPQLPKDGESFRLQKSCDTLTRLEKEEKHYEGVRKKYNRARSVFQNISVGSGTLSIVLSMGGLGVSLSGFGIVVGAPVGAIGGICGLISVLTGFYSKKLGKKVSKHERTAVMASSKINTIKDLVSKALSDEKISAKEFSLIVKEVDKFEELKLRVRGQNPRKKKREKRKKV